MEKLDLEYRKNDYVDNYVKKYGNKPSYSVVTHGCQMNENDSGKIKALLESMGFVESADKLKADFIIFNTCLVRDNAEQKVFGQLGSLKNLKKENPDMLIAVCGCMMQTGDAKDIIREKYKNVDIIFGVNNISSLPSLIERHLASGELEIDTSVSDDIDQIVTTKRDNNINGYVNIMTGCNNFCTYCIVPYARGREKSRSVASIVSEVEDMVSRGYKEVTLLGQNVNSYGKNLEEPVTFTELLKIINDIDGLERIRFLTSHPKDISDDLIEAIGSLDKVCENIHLPFQAGSNAVLKRMNRKYTREDYLEIIAKLRKACPDITFSTDIIVGFPGETEEDFQDTLDLVKQVRYEQAFTFKYNRRPGTKADLFEDQIDEDVKQDRFQRLLDVLYPIFYEENKKYLNTDQEVLIEGVSKNNPDILTGRTRTFKLVNVKGDKSLIGKLVNVHINDFNSFALSGEYRR
ncbi:MAG: tRNA (N6-isopentenyl adenosine(37)-C2)-methylthiotransferase MiaB [Finegoldia sp.]|nr:tRNA (N6-isopentenyl adenosine(37)-C2)-methylthiotransferase MiaB [Finegoldia sp.]